MSYLSICTPIDHLVRSGTYGNIKNNKPNYTMLHQKDISIAKIIPYSTNDISHISPLLKSLLGVITPVVGHVYVSGTRKILRIDETTFIVTTEGEARGVLYERLNYNIHHHAMVHDETPALTVLRIDGYYLYNILSHIIEDLSILPTQINQCCSIKIDQASIICHLSNNDTLFLYIERAYAYDIYARIARLCLPLGLKIL